MKSHAQSKSSSSGKEMHFCFPIHLSPRQLQVLLMMCNGLPNKLVGRQLGISTNTVKSHVASVLRSLNVTSRLEAVTIAYKLGLVHVGTHESTLTMAATPMSTTGAPALAERIHDLMQQ